MCEVNYQGWSCIDCCFLNVTFLSTFLVTSLYISTNRPNEFTEMIISGSVLVLFWQNQGTERSFAIIIVDLFSKILYLFIYYYYRKHNISEIKTTRNTCSVQHINNTQLGF